MAARHTAEHCPHGALNADLQDAASCDAQDEMHRDDGNPAMGGGVSRAQFNQTVYCVIESPKVIEFSMDLVMNRCVLKGSTSTRVQRMRFVVLRGLYEAPTGAQAPCISSYNSDLDAWTQDACKAIREKQGLAPDFPVALAHCIERVVGCGAGEYVEWSSSQRTAELRDRPTGLNRCSSVLCPSRRRELGVQVPEATLAPVPVAMKVLPPAQQQRLEVARQVSREVRLGASSCVPRPWHLQRRHPASG